MFKSGTISYPMNNRGRRREHAGGVPLNSSIQVLVHHVVIVAQQYPSDRLLSVGPISLLFFQNVFLGILRSFWSLKCGFFNIFRAWSSDRYEGTLNFFTCQTRQFWSQMDPDLQIRSVLDIFTCPFLISGLYFSLNQPEMDFSRHFSGPKLPNASKVMVFFSEFA